MHIVVMTKDEVEAFRLLAEATTQVDSDDRVYILDDYSSDEYICKVRSEFPMCVVVQHALCDNFSMHRNSVKSVVPDGEWIVMLDADEMVMPGFVRGVQETICRFSNVDALYFQRYNTLYRDGESDVPRQPSEGEKFNDDFQGRGFKNRSEICYSGIVHEQLGGFKLCMLLSGKPFTILHHKSVNKVERYRHLVCSV
jgi:glycosyltransferase involved in cell wall biosynthesis